MSEKLLYLFCLSDKKLSGKDFDFSEVTVEPYFYETDSFTAVLAKVEKNDFIGEAAESRLQNMDWLIPRVLEHEKIIETVRQKNGVLPVPFGTIFETELNLKRLLIRNTKRISTFFEQTRDCHELGVKGFFRRDELLENSYNELLSSHAAEFAEMSAGKRYLAEKRLRDEAAKSLYQYISTFCGKLDYKLQTLTADKKIRKPVAAAVPEGFEALVNWAFLIPKKNVAEFRQLLETETESYNQRGIIFNYTAELPPYSFVPNLDLELL